MNDLGDFQRLLAEHASAKQAKDRPGQDRAAAAIVETLRRHPEWKPFAPPVLWNRSKG